MKDLVFDYHMTIEFDQPVYDHRFTVKCIPEDTKRQEIRNLSVSVVPNQSLSEGRDSFGNRCIYGHCKMEHEALGVRVRGRVKTGLAGWEIG